MKRFRVSYTIAGQRYALPSHGETSEDAIREIYDHRIVKLLLKDASYVGFLKECNPVAVEEVIEY